jgi:hypothetical protein
LAGFYYKKRGLSIKISNLSIPDFLRRLGFRVEEFGSSGSAGLPFSIDLPTYPPQREACGQMALGARPGETIPPCVSPRDRPDPMKESPPQDDDPNSSSPNPMRSASLSATFSAIGTF